MRRSGEQRELRPVNQWTGRPESIIAFGAFVEQQWQVLVLPTFKRTTQHGYQTVLKVRPAKVV